MGQSSAGGRGRAHAAMPGHLCDNLASLTRPAAADDNACVKKSPELSAIPVAAVLAETHETVRLQLAPVPASFLEAYERAGQYVMVARDGGELAPYAIASAPAQEPVELLVRRGGERGADLALAAVGERVQVGLPSGPGFPLAASCGADLVLVGMGAAVSALRAVVVSVMRERKAWGRVSIFLGARLPHDFPFRDEFVAWRAAGIEIHPAASNISHEDSVHRRGRVQDSLRRSTPPLRNAHVFAAGSTAMLAELATLMHELGLPEGRFHTNIGRGAKAERP